MKKELELQKKNIHREDESKKKIENAKKEIEAVLAKYNLTITPILQITDVGFEDEIIKQAMKGEAQKI